MSKLTTLKHVKNKILNISSIKTLKQIPKQRTQIKKANNNINNFKKHSNRYLKKHDYKFPKKYWKYEKNKIKPFFFFCYKYKKKMRWKRKKNTWKKRLTGGLKKNIKAINLFYNSKKLFAFLHFKKFTINFAKKLKKKKKFLKNRLKNLKIIFFKKLFHRTFRLTKYIYYRNYKYRYLRSNPREPFFFSKKFLRKVYRNVKKKFRIKKIKKNKKKMYKFFSLYNFTYNSATYTKLFKKLFYHNTHNFGKIFFKNLRILLKYQKQKKYAYKTYKTIRTLFKKIKKESTQISKPKIPQFFLKKNTFALLYNFFQKGTFIFKYTSKFVTKTRKHEYIGYLFANTKFFMLFNFLRHFFLNKTYRTRKFRLQKTSLKTYVKFLGASLFKRQTQNFKKFKKILKRIAINRPYRKIMHKNSWRALARF